MIARKTSLIGGLTLVALSLNSTNAMAASYRVDFAATWSAQTHPNALPAGAHFSSLIGGVHSDNVSFWTPGGIASNGIEQMAELGGTSLLRSEVQAAMNVGTASSIISGGGTGSPGSASTMFQVSAGYPLVTLVTMVAPSPDWFVGVHGLDLRDGEGWKSQLTVDLFTYDAGTDDGANFTSPDVNVPVTSRHPITLLGAPFAPTDPRLGTFTFTKMYEGRPLGDYNADGTVDAADYTVWRNSLGRMGIDLGADGDLDGTIDVDDFSIWRNHFGTTVPAEASGAASSAAAPEPNSAMLLFAGAALIAALRAVQAKCP